MNRIRFSVLIIITILILGSCQEDRVDREFYENDVIKKELFYKDGKVFKQLNYLKSGELDSEYEMKSGKKDGKAIIYFLGGEKKAVLYYKDGNKNGECILYKKDGSVFEVLEYKDGNLVGE